jgi:hypothetical protein
MKTPRAKRKGQVDRSETLASSMSRSPDGAQRHPGLTPPHAANTRISLRSMRATLPPPPWRETAPPRPRRLPPGREIPGPSAVHRWCAGWEISRR